MKVKKIILIIGVILLVVASGWLFLMKLFFEDMENKVFADKGQEIIKTSLGDEFLFKYESINLTDYDTYVDVFHANNRIGYYHMENSFIKPEITVQIDSNNIRCYEVTGLLIYRCYDGVFKGINRSQIDDEYMTKINPELINSELRELGKALIAKNKWKWIEFFGKFLVKADDNDTKKTLERYAIGQFTQEELDLNKESEIKKEDMQAFAKQVLE